MTVQKRPDDNIFASSAKSGEVENFPDLTRGWGIAFDQTEGKPPMEWFNALFKRQDEAIRYLLQQGLPEWSATEDYPIHALTRVGAKVYRAISANINKAPATNAVIWKEWGLDADLVLLKENNLSEIKEKGEEAQKAARDNIGAIAASDVNLKGYVPTTRKINSKALSEDIALTATDVGAAQASHGHTTAQITGLDTALASKAPTSHAHTTAQVTGLDTALASKAPTSHSHTTAQITGLDTALAGKAATNASNIVVADYLNKLGLKDSSLSQNGWVKFPSGLIIQWFTINKNAMTNDTRFSVNFPISFPNLSLQVILSSTAGAVFSGSTEGMTIINFDKLSVDVVSAWNSWPANSAEGKTNDIRFLAIGY